MIEEQMRKLREGMTLQEKIAEHQEKVLGTNVVSHITDAFFEQVEEGGDIFYLRRTNLMRDNGRTLNIIDEIQIAEERARAEHEEEEKRDRVYEEFKTGYGGHLAGTEPNNREYNHSEDEEDGSKSKKSISKMNRTASRIADPINEDDDDEHAGSKRGSQRQSQHNVGDYKSLSLNKTTENFKFEIPTSCHVSMMKKVLIEKKMPFQYVLASHPYPKHEGEMIIFKPKRED